MDLIEQRAAEDRIERLYQMIQYAELSLQPDTDLRDRMYCLVQMLRGEMNREADRL